MQLDRAERNLGENWRTLTQGDTNREFWIHEYMCYGSDVNYFLVAERMVLYNFTKILEDAGIVKSKDIMYSRAQIEDAVQSTIGRNLNFYLNCAVVGDTYFLLMEITVCFIFSNNDDITSNQFISCPQRTFTRTNCGSTLEDRFIVLDF